MKRLLLAFVLVLAVGGAGCLSFTGSQTVRGSGNTIIEERPVTGFDRVSVSGAGDLVVVQGDEESLTIEADDNLLPLIRSEVRNGQLSIEPRNVNLRPSRTIQFRLKLKQLNQLEMSGAMNVEADTIKAERLAFHLSGAGKIEVRHLDAELLATDITGAGSMSAAGRAETQEIRISGAGKHHAPELKSGRANAHITGAGHASLWVTEFLNAHISGSGSVDYSGDARVESHVSGAGSVRHRRGPE